MDHIAGLGAQLLTALFHISVKRIITDSVSSLLDFNQLLLGTPLHLHSSTRTTFKTDDLTDEPIRLAGVTGLAEDRL